MPNDIYDAIVVGGGHNGLVAACYLAKSKKKVLLLESQDTLGGATTSVKTFQDYDAYLSRYSYLVSLLPDQIISDLGINFCTLPRPVASCTPYQRDGQHGGLLIHREWDATTAESFYQLTGSTRDSHAWQTFYNAAAEFAKRLAPTMLQPLRTASALKANIGLQTMWQHLIENPIDEFICNQFFDDLIRGVVLTDALIGTFVSAGDLQANRCFLYHIIGNGTGEWKVPRGGMGVLIHELHRIARNSGVDIQLQSRVDQLESGSNGVAVKTVLGKRYTARDLLFAAAPQHLARLRNLMEPASLSGAQIKINMLLTRLPQLKAGIDPNRAFAGTFHVNESYSQLEAAYRDARHAQIPHPLPLEVYCHTLTDSTILSDELIQKGFHTLTLFGLHTPIELFEKDPEKTKARVTQRALTSLNDYLLEPIESVLAPCSDGSLAIEVKTPIDLETDVALPQGNIFHRDLDFPFLEDDSLSSAQELWGAETDDPHIFLAGSGARRGGGVSGIAGHNAAMALLSKDS